MSVREAYAQLGAAVCINAERAQRIVAEALPYAIATLGGNTTLDVRAERVEAHRARGGSLIPAWPLRDSSGSVVIEYVDDWGALLATWISVVQPEKRALALDLVTTGQRVWIGIANDVMQLFVTDPPESTYSMVRHHALMLAAATSWLGAQAIENWRIAHSSAANAFLARHRAQSLWTAVDAAERGLDALLLDPRCRQPAPDALEWLDSDPAASDAYTDFLGAASLGVAAVLGVMHQADMPADRWLQHTVADCHRQPDFNKQWMETRAGELSYDIR